MESKRAATGLLAVFLVTGFGVIPQTGASAASGSGETRIIARNADTYVNSIRAYFFCQTATCKKTRNAEKTAAAAGMRALVAEAKTVSVGSVPSGQKAVVAKFVADVGLLAAAYTAYPQESGAQAIAKNTGLIYYQSANVGSDTYLLSVEVNGGSVAYVPWSVGAVAVLYAMQLDTQALNVKSATVGNDISACQNLEREATSLASDANGPNARFNSLIAAFAKTQEEVSANEILILRGQKALISNSKLSSLSDSLGKQFKQIVDLQSTLSKG